MSNKQQNYHRSNPPWRRGAFLLWLCVFTCGFFFKWYAGVDNNSRALASGHSACAISSQLITGAVQAGALKGIKTKQSIGFYQTIFQSEKIRAAFQHDELMHITYGPSTLYKKSNQQAFLRLDLPPPSQPQFY